MDLTLPSGTPAMSKLIEGAVRGLVVVPDIWGLRGLYSTMVDDLATRTGWSVVAIEPFPGQDLGGAADPTGFDDRSAALRAIDDDRLLGDAVAARGSTEVMAIVGTVDTWTPPADVDALEALGVEVVRYEGADHGFVHDPSRPAHRPDDAADAWSRALAFLAG